MAAMQRALLFGIGLTLTSLLLYIPALYVRAWSGLEVTPLAMLVMALPLVVLAAAVLSRRDSLVLWAFPCSHLPALFAIPQLASSRLYHEWEGLAAFVAMVVVGCAYVGVGLRQLGPSDEVMLGPEHRGRKGASIISGISIALSLTIFGIFAGAVILQPQADATSANVTILVALLASWFVVGKIWLPRLGHPLMDEAAMEGICADVLFVRRPSQQTLVTAVVVTIVTFSVLLVFHTFV